jgi:transposase
MAARFVHVDHDTALLLPPDLRDWISKDHMVHFIMDAVDALDLTTAKTNERGTGSAQYPPATMLALLIYCDATGTFASRRIETLTYENVAVRSLCADTHPDHDSICKFRRENKALLASCFHQILELATIADILKVGKPKRSSKNVPKSALKKNWQSMSKNSPNERPKKKKPDASPVAKRPNPPSPAPGPKTNTISLIPKAAS